MRSLQPATNARARSPANDETAAEAADTNMPAATYRSRLGLPMPVPLVLVQQLLAVQDIYLVQALTPLAVQLLAQDAVLLLTSLTRNRLAPPLPLAAVPSRHC